MTFSKRKFFVRPKNFHCSGSVTLTGVTVSGRDCIDMKEQDCELSENPKHLWRGQHGDAPGAAIPSVFKVAVAATALPAEPVQFGEGVVGQVVAGVVGLPAVAVAVVLLARPPAEQIGRLELSFPHFPSLP